MTTILFFAALARPFLRCCPSSVFRVRPICENLWYVNKLCPPHFKLPWYVRSPFDLIAELHFPLLDGILFPLKMNTLPLSFDETKGDVDRAPPFRLLYPTVEGKLYNLPAPNPPSSLNVGSGHICSNNTGRCREVQALVAHRERTSCDIFSGRNSTLLKPLKQFDEGASRPEYFNVLDCQANSDSSL